jgi:hypothetical protein
LIITPLRHDIIIDIITIIIIDIPLHYCHYAIGYAIDITPLIIDIIIDIDAIIDIVYYATLTLYYDDITPLLISLHLLLSLHY